LSREKEVKEAADWEDKIENRKSKLERVLCWWVRRGRDWMGGVELKQRESRVGTGGMIRKGSLEELEEGVSKGNGAAELKRWRRRMGEEVDTGRREGRGEGS
jgi:hypothetical protein